MLDLNAHPVACCACFKPHSDTSARGRRSTYLLRTLVVRVIVPRRERVGAHEDAALDLAAQAIVARRVVHRAQVVGRRVIGEQPGRQRPTLRRLRRRLHDRRGSLSKGDHVIIIYKNLLGYNVSTHATCLSTFFTA